MAIDNTSIGSVLTIPKELLDNLEAVDKKISNIQKRSEEMTKAVNSNFATLAKGDIVTFLSQLTSVYDKIGGIGTKIGQGISSGMKQASQTASQMGSSITQASEQINRMSAAQKANMGTIMRAYTEWTQINQQVGILEGKIQNINGFMKQYEKTMSDIKNGKGGVVSQKDMQTYAEYQKQLPLLQQELAILREKQTIIARNNVETANVNREIQRQIESTRSLVTYAQSYDQIERQTLEIQKRMSSFYREQEKLASEKAKQVSKEADEYVKAEERKQKAIQKTAAEQKKWEAQQRANTEKAYSQTFAYGNYSVSSALKVADSARSINERTEAIKMLEAVRAKLNTTDAKGRAELENLNAKIKELNAANRQAVASSKELLSTHRSLCDTVGQLQRQFALLFSVSQIQGYVKQIAETRGYFELQQKSLQAILQNKVKADEIFQKTMALALESPFRAKQLITYTKQLAAYRIENDKLYDTTKRLADISAGLGVDMQRLILAYGQVKAAAYLRGTEVRQFTEAGINLYGELQAYFKEVKGEAYTTAQIVDMISKRKVTFEDIEQIFKRLTDQGGLFYNMQKIQVETLQGKIGKLKDAIDQMQNAIGKNNETLLKGGVDAAIWLTQNYKALGYVVEAIVGAFVGYKVAAFASSAASLSLRKSLFGVSAGFLMNIKTMGIWKGSAYSLMGVAKSLRVALATLKSAMIGIGMVFAIDAAVAYFQKQKEITKEIEKSESETAKLRAQVSKIVYDFDKLKKTSNQLLSEGILSGDKTKFNASIEEKRKKLQELIDFANKQGMKINIDVYGLNLDDIDSQFEKLRKESESFITYINIVKQRVAESNGQFIYDGLSEKAGDYDKIANKIIVDTYKIDDAINIAAQHYGEADKQSKKYFDTLIQGRKEGEDDLVYYSRMVEALKMIEYHFVSSKTIPSEWALMMQKRLKETKERFEDLGFAAGGFKDELIKVLGSKEEMQRKWNNDPLKIKAAIDEMGLSEEAKKAAYVFVKQFYGIKIPVERPKDEELTQEARDIFWVLQNYFDKNKIKIKADVSGLDPNKALQSIQDFGKDWRGWVELEKQIQKSNINTAHTLAEIGLQGKIAGKELGLTAKIVDQNTKVSKTDLLKVIALLKDEAKARADAWGVNPFEKENTKKDKAAEKAQRDLIKERIEAYKELQSQYEKYLKMYDKETAKTKALESLKYKLQNAGIYGDAVGIFPDEKTIAEKIKGLAAQYKDLSKRGDAYKIVADLLLQIDQEQLKKELDAAKTEIDDAFSGLNVYTDLKKLGLGESDIAKMFGDLPKTFDDVQKKIAEVYNGKEGEDWAKQRQETEKKLQEQVVKYNLDTFKELTKAYKTNLSDQLQLDEWYYAERMKIMQNEQLKAHPEMQKQYLTNLDKQYAEKSDANSWKQFQESEYYIKIFENLDVVSSRVLKEMSSRLENIRGSLKNLSPEQLKQVVSATEQINTQLVSRNPFKGLLKNIKGYAAFQKKRNDLEQKFIDSSAKETNLQSQSKQQSEIVRQKKEEYDAAVKTHGAMSGQAGIAYNAYKTEKAKLDVILDELVAQGKITQAYADQIRSGEKIKKTLQEQVKGIADQFSQLSSGWGEFESMMSNFGVEFPEEIGGALNGLSQASGGISKIVNGDIIGGLFSTISGVGNTVASLFGFGSKDNKLQKRIEEQERAIKRLQWAYEDLKESMDNAMSAADLLINKDDMIDNLNATNASLRSMISMEQSKKHTDSGKIDEWQRQIQENNKAIKELEQTVTEQMGGFGSDSNFKSAAQEFADAWVDAFNEGSDALEALEGKFDDYFNNLLKKQLMMRAADTYIKPILAAFDAAVAEGSAGGNNGLDVTEEELNRIKELKDTNLALFDEYAKGLMEILGVSPTTSASLSDLQQGIQSLSESTGQALESLLNSIRFFVAQQSTDVAAIRQLLAAGSSLNTTTDTNTPMLKELQAQTNYLSKIYSMLGSVVKAGGHPKAGAGIKVFQD